MKFTTIIKALNPIINQLMTYSGPIVEGISFEDAQNYCENNGLGYCKVDGILISEIPITDDNIDWDNRIDYDFDKN